LKHRGAIATSFHASNVAFSILVLYHFTHMLPSAALYEAMTWRVSLFQTTHTAATAIATPPSMLEDGILVQSRTTQNTARTALVLVMLLTIMTVHLFLRRSIHNVQVCWLEGHWLRCFSFSLFFFFLCFQNNISCLGVTRSEVLKSTLRLTCHRTLIIIATQDWRGNIG